MIRLSSECDRCQRFSGYLGDEFLVCAVHPSGPAQTPCPDFAEVVEDCVPFGAAYYNGELILDGPSYLTTAERLELIETHPMFTGKCLNGGEAFAEVPIIHWDCEGCNWKDDSVV
ncbi:MAG: hypothetical protein HC852_01960 [Acaryochloridaceae cyanobacterium RU_4_10]|nr:hypothetical protein [Acaryochloridaceae cyanobacterium RU_4_10]